MNAVIAEYGKNHQAQALDVTPHRLVQMLMQNAIDKMAIGKGCMERHDIEGAHQNLSLAMTIIMTLRGSLDMDAGGEISVNLDLLYGYMNTRLLESISKQDPKAIDEISALMKELARGWAGMPQEIKDARDLSQFAGK
jgi:flagellar protein FliS